MLKEYNEAASLDSTMRELMDTEAYVFSNLQTHPGMTIGAVFDCFCELVREGHHDLIKRNMISIRKKIKNGLIMSDPSTKRGGRKKQNV